MPRSVTLFLMATLLSLLTTASVMADGDPEWRRHLDAMWLNRNPVPHEHCLSFIVKAWADHLLRGRISPHDCVAFAIREYRRGDHEQALGWLQAGLCPDRDAQQELVRRAPAVFQFLLSTYGPQVP
ncbi:MAG: hypothetical protein NW703_16340 [Nitrospiraceae bacterium]